MERNRKCLKEKWKCRTYTRLRFAHQAVFMRERPLPREMGMNNVDPGTLEENALTSDRLFCDFIQTCGCYKCSARLS